MAASGATKTDWSTEALAHASLAVLRAFAAIADQSLSEVAPSMTLKQFRALTVLDEQGPQNAASLAAELGVAPSTLTRLADRLVRDRLIDRVPDPSDRRAVVLSVTRRGAQTAARVKARRLEALAAVFDAVGGDERDALGDAFRLAADLLEDREARR